MFQKWSRSDLPRNIKLNTLLVGYIIVLERRFNFVRQHGFA